MSVPDRCAGGCAAEIAELRSDLQALREDLAAEKALGEEARRSLTDLGNALLEMSMELSRSQAIEPAVDRLTASLAEIRQQSAFPAPTPIFAPREVETSGRKSPHQREMSEQQAAAAAAAAREMAVIANAVADAFRTDLDSLRTRDRRFMPARNIAILLMREHLHVSFPQMADFFDRRDHTTMIFGYNQAQAKLKRDPELRAFVDRLWSSIEVVGAA